MSKVGETFLCGDWLELRKVGKTEFASRVWGSGVIEIVATTVIEGVPHFIFIEQFRPAINSRCIELPAGVVGDHDANEDPKWAVERELIEETGYRAGKIEFLAKGPSSAGMSDEIMDFYYASELEKIGSGGGVGDENITIHEVPTIELDMWLIKKIQDGIMVDPRVWAGMYLVRHIPPEKVGFAPHHFKK